MTWAVSADPAEFAEALDWLRKRTVITADAARALDTRRKAEAFWVGGGLQLEQIQRVFRKVDRAIAKGVPFEEFRKAVRDELTNDAHTETVFRNAAQRAYNAGRWHQMTEASVQRFRPFWMFDAVLDTRTTKEICRPRDSTILAADDPWWDANWPPLHHRCRSGVRNLRRSEAEGKGISASPPPDSPPDGWGASPRLNAAPWKPTPATHDPALVASLEAKQGKQRPRKPRSKKEHRPTFWVEKYSDQYGNAAPAVAWGRAAVERGLDMRIDDVRQQLERVGDVPGVRMMLDSMAGLPGTATLREQAGELDPLRRAGAGMAGHLRALKARPNVSHPDLVSEPIGARALRFFSVATDKKLRHPDGAWTIAKTTKRAFCNPAKKRIEFNVGAGVLEHEWGHSLEDLNPRLLTAARDFLERRTQGEKLQKLNKLTKYAYPDHEIAKPDGFVDPYTGKFYLTAAGKPWATEITSTGLELLVAGQTKWGTLEELLVKDPDHFHFVLGQLAHQ